MRPFLRRRWFLISLAALLVAGVSYHRDLAPAVDRLPADALVVGVLFVMAFSLRTRDVGTALRRPVGWLIAIGVSLVFLPPLAWAAGRWLVRDLADGLVIATAVPCTLGSAAVMTRRAGGNDVIALVVTLLTNLACFIVTPAWLKVLTGRTGGPEQDFAELVSKLAVLVVLPIVVGQLLRQPPRIGHWATRHRIALGVVAQIGILAMVLIGAVRCGQQLGTLSTGIAPVAWQLVAVVGMVAGIHLAAWALGYWAARRVGLPEEDQPAVAFAGSQKTLMIGLAIALDFGGLAVLPMMAYHIEQLLIDTLLADRWRERRHGGSDSRPLAGG
jgi:solute carrier family 10 (sodium/bile acid cotransporter), member 7